MTWAWILPNATYAISGCVTVADKQSQLTQYLENRSFWEESDGRFRFRDLKNIQKHTCYLIPMAFVCAKFFGKFFKKIWPAEASF